MLHRAQNGGPGDLRWLGIRRLAVGTRGRDVRLLQKDLTKLGYTAASDGQFGPQTRFSVRSFERAAGLKIDGVMSPREARTLKKVVRSGTDAGAVSQQPTTATATTTATPTATQIPPTSTPTPPAQPTGQAATSPPAVASIGADGLAIAPAGAPAAVVAIIAAGNAIAHFPYRYGGGHDTWHDTGYDCSGSVSFALHGAGLLDTPMSSYDFPAWGESGPGQWVTVYARQDHAYMVVAGLRFDTSASKGGGSRWTTEPRSPDRLRGASPRRPARPQSAPPERARRSRRSSLLKGTDPRGGSARDSAAARPDRASHRGPGPEGTASTPFRGANGPPSMTSSAYQRTSVWLGSRTCSTAPETCR